MRIFYLIVFYFFFSFYIKADANYIVEVHGTIKEVKTHKYTETDNLKFLTIDGTFKDNLGNFGQTNSLVYMLTKNNVVEKLESYNEFLYDNNIKAYNLATRSSEDLESGVGKILSMNTCTKGRYHQSSNCYIFRRTSS